jgi:hypothetical protein
MRDRALEIVGVAENASTCRSVSLIDPPSRMGRRRPSCIDAVGQTWSDPAALAHTVCRAVQAVDAVPVSRRGC